MPTNHTENFNLSQWEKTDKVQMEDFNADNVKIDAAIAAAEAAIPKVAAGTYTGNGAATRIIELGFTPRLAYVCLSNGVTYSRTGYTNYSGGLAVPEAAAGPSAHPAVKIVEGGFQVEYYQPNNETVYTVTNSSGAIYYYFAIG